MPQIFVDTDNSDPKDKLFVGTKAGGAKAEEKMQKVVIRIIGKTDGFTTDPKVSKKGYAIRLTVSKVEVGDHETKCAVSGSLVRRPREKVKGGEGEVMVSTSMGGSGKVNGTDDGAILDCVEAISEDLVKKSIKYMKEDWTKR